MTQSAYAAIRRHGEESYPQECCGVLLGRFQDDVRAVTAAVRAANARQDAPHNRYSIAPRELVRIQREAREQGLDIVGFYHSHPDHGARWSATDLAEAHWVGCSYLITSVEQGVAKSTCSFALLGSVEDDKRFEDEALEVAPEAAPAPAQGNSKHAA